MNNLPFFFNHHLKRLAKQFFPNEMTDGEPQNAAIDKAFEIFTIGIILEKSFDEVKRNIWIEGKEDGGIDGVYIDHQARKLLAFQCKNKANLSANDIEKFRDNFRQVFQEGKAKEHSTDLINKLKQLRYEDILESEVYDFKMCFVFNGETSSDNNYHIIRQIDDARLTFFDLTKLHQGIADLMMTEEKRRPVKFIFRPENSNTELSDAQALISFAINSIKAVNFRISAKHLCELVEEEQRTNGSIGELFSGNIRGYLGRDNFTNKKMIETLQSNDRYFFPFLNNGVTMICSRFRLPANKQLGNYLIESENPVIVNGLQTTNILYEQYKTAPESLHNVFVLIRLYETDQQDLIDLITDATNTQSAIDFRDKLSNKPFMKNLKAFFAENGVDLVTKRGDTFRSFIKNDTIRPSVESSLALQNWYDIFVGNDWFNYTNITEGIFESLSNKESSLFRLIDTDIFRQQALWANWLNHELEIKIFSLENSKILNGKNWFISFGHEVQNIILKKAVDTNFDKKAIILKIDDISNLIKNHNFENSFENLFKKMDSNFKPFTFKRLQNLHINTDNLKFS